MAATWACVPGNNQNNMISRRTLMLGLAAAMAGGLGACREEELDRPLSYEKGKYIGKKGTRLNDEQLRALQQRHRNQAGGGL